MDKIIEFQAVFNKQLIEGYMYLDEKDDETPLRFYESNGLESWKIPQNPNNQNLHQKGWNDYDYLKTVFQETNIVQYLCDSEEKFNLIKLSETESEEDTDVLLIINGEITINNIDNHWKIIDFQGQVYGDGETIQDCIKSATILAE